jgi:hypothetical protein
VGFVPVIARLSLQQGRPAYAGLFIFRRLAGTLIQLDELTAQIDNAQNAGG